MLGFLEHTAPHDFLEFLRLLIFDMMGIEESNILVSHLFGDLYNLSICSDQAFLNILGYAANVTASKSVC